MPVVGCLSEQQLRDFQFGDLPESDLAGVAAHLDACPQCESLAQRLDSQTDPMLNAIRRTVRTSRDETRVIRRFSPPSNRPDTMSAMELPPSAPSRRGRLGLMLAVLALGAGIGISLPFLADAFRARYFATAPEAASDVVEVAVDAPAAAGNAAPAGPSSGIAWFATWESGLREAQRTGKPILLVAAAPSCAGVSGVW